MIEFDGVTKYYEGNPVLKQVSLSIDRGEMTFITGPSGAGKTTFLKLIFLAEPHDEGTIVVDGVETAMLRESEIPYLRRKIGVVFQDFRLLKRTVFENVALALRIRNVPEAAIRPLVNETLKMVNLRHKADNMAHTLSGGEQQRVAIARAIVGEPSVLLADEPTGNLDPETSAGIMKIFKEINARGTTVLHATHNRELFKNTGNRVFRIENSGVTVDTQL